MEYLISNKNEERVGFFIYSYLCMLISYNIFRRMFSLSEKNGYIFLALLLCLFIGVNVKFLFNLLKRKWVILLLIESIFLIVFLLSILRGNISFTTALQYMVYTLLVCGPMFCAGFFVKNLEEIYRYMLHHSKFLLTIASLTMFNKGNGIYNMSFSYILLLPTLIFLNETFRRKKFRDILLTVYLLALILSYGSRGPILCIIIFLILRTLFVFDNIKLSIVTILLTLVIILNYSFIGTKILEILSNNGIYSRTLSLLFSNIKYLSGRDIILERTLKLVNLNPILGLGAGSDIDLIGAYPHNIFLEFIFDFGYPFGLMLSLLLIFSLFYFLIGNKDSRDLSIIFIVWGFCPLLVSGTYLKSWMFFFLLGMVFSSKFKNIRHRQVIGSNFVGR